MKRVTDFAQVDYIVPDGTPLPDEIRSYLNLCVSKPVENSRTGKTGKRYRIPRYKMTEWLRKYNPNPVNPVKGQPPCRQS